MKDYSMPSIHRMAILLLLASSASIGFSLIAIVGLIDALSAGEWVSYLALAIVSIGAAAFLVRTAIGLWQSDGVISTGRQPVAVPVTVRTRH